MPAQAFTLQPIQSIDYYLCEPNLILLHDQFLRLFPKLSKHKITHLLCYAEKLPFKSGTVDLIMSISSIDHFKDYKSFFKEAYRITKDTGRVFVTSHLETKKDIRIQNTSIKSKLFKSELMERITRYLFLKKYRVKDDDHVNHFETIQPIEEALLAAGFIVEDKEEFLGNFWIIGKKQ